jgi:hypothetical protein
MKMGRIPSVRWSAHARTASWLCVAAGVVLGATLCAGAAYAGGKSSGTSVPDLSGAWSLDSAKSDDPREKMEAARPGGPGGRGGPGGGGHGGPMGGGPPGGGPPGGGPPGGGPEGGGPPQGEHGQQGARPDSALMHRVMHPAAALSIRQDTTDVFVAEGQQEARRILIVDEKPETKVARNVFYHDGRKLVEVSPLGPRSRLRETYEVSKDGRTLTVIARIEGDDERMPTVEIRQVYSRNQLEGGSK